MNEIREQQTTISEENETQGDYDHESASIFDNLGRRAPNIDNDPAVEPPQPPFPEDGNGFKIIVILDLKTINLLDGQAILKESIDADKHAGILIKLPNHCMVFSSENGDPMALNSRETEGIMDSTSINDTLSRFPFVAFGPQIVNGETKGDRRLRNERDAKILSAQKVGDLSIKDFILALANCHIVLALLTSCDRQPRI